MAVWIKPSGIEIEINDKAETVAFAENLGWERKGAKKKASPAKKKGSE